MQTCILPMMDGEVPTSPTESSKGDLMRNIDYSSSMDTYMQTKLLYLTQKIPPFRKKPC